MTGETRLGAHWDGRATTFAVRAEIAYGVELCLFDADGRESRVAMERADGECWRARVEGVGPGQAYGYRVSGPWSPRRGFRANPRKLLLDPYARAIDGRVRWDAAVLPYAEGDDLRASDADSAPFVPRSIVIDPSFDWAGDQPPKRAWTDTVIYELHVKGFTARHPGVPAELRGRYAGLAHESVIGHLTSLGITAVELLPIQHFVHESYLLDRGLTNYWGYQTIGFFAPHHEYAAAADATGRVREFKSMVKALHAAGIEVILDVVYNHTPEGHQLGPSLCFKGLDNGAYYRLGADPRFYADFTGTGNSIDTTQPAAADMIVDSLKYWVTEMHVDGFRFDLASTLARGLGDHIDPHQIFIPRLLEDDVLKHVKLIAEPWDLGPGGYQVGGFPDDWREWNDRFRDSVRDFWRGQDGAVPELATRVAGSAATYQGAARPATSSINFVTVHDGFTLADLVSYNDKHNEANREDNNDGSSDNRSWNCGAEGPTDDAGVLQLRARQARNILATILLSRGVPMLLAGDEMGRTQGGNNNAYCQDNEISWVDWEHADGSLIDFTRELIALRRRLPGIASEDWNVDYGWYQLNGEPMAEGDWGQAERRGLSLIIRDDGAAILIAFNAHDQEIPLVLPKEFANADRKVVLSTSDPSQHDLIVGGRSLLVVA